LRKENYAGLVKLGERRLAGRPGELYAQIGRGETYVLSGEYDKVLAWLSELHRKVPDQPDVQHLILDTLFAKNSTVGNCSPTPVSSRTAPLAGLSDA
jgi:predicted Zn-dependent protease